MFELCLRVLRNPAKGHGAASEQPLEKRHRGHAVRETEQTVARVRRNRHGTDRLPGVHRIGNGQRFDRHVREDPARQDGGLDILHRARPRETC